MPEPGADEDVRLRAHAWISVERARRHEDDIVLVHRRHGRPASAAERASAGRRRSVDLHELLAAQPSKLTRRHADRDMEQAACMFAAHRAVTVSHPAIGWLDAIPSLPAQAASVDHDAPTYFF